MKQRSNLIITMITARRIPILVSSYYKLHACQQCCQNGHFGKQYCDYIFHHIVNFDNIVIIYDKNIVAPYGENILQYCHNIGNFHNIE